MIMVERGTEKRILFLCALVQATDGEYMLTLRDTM